MNWLKRLFKSDPPSGNVAKNRLQMVLTHDRNEISPGMIELIKDDIIEVIAKHMTIDSDNVVVNLTRGASESRLVAEIPLQNGSRRR